MEQLAMLQETKFSKKGTLSTCGNITQMPKCSMKEDTALKET